MEFYVLDVFLKSFRNKLPLYIFGIDFLIYNLNVMSISQNVYFFFAVEAICVKYSLFCYFLKTFKVTKNHLITI